MIKITKHESRMQSRTSSRIPLYIYNIIFPLLSHPVSFPPILQFVASPPPFPHIIQKPPTFLLLFPPPPSLVPLKWSLCPTFILVQFPMLPLSLLVSLRLFFPYQCPICSQFFKQCPSMVYLVSLVSRIYYACFRYYTKYKHLNKLIYPIHFSHF